MKWNWQLPNWPQFTFDPSLLVDLEKSFLQGAGGAFAVLKHLGDEKKRQFIVEILCVEGLNSAEIEGEILQRESLQFSIQRHFGFSIKNQKIPSKEQGMGDLMWDTYDTYDQVLTHEMLHNWHRLLMGKKSKLSDVGRYRTHTNPMQIISERLDKQTIYFEAPPSKDVRKKMDIFIKWFNESRNKESILARAAIAHVYFESIHPFEDGNGRIGRALVEKALSQSLKQPTLIAISQVVTQRKKEYYAALAACNKTLNVEKWVKYFAEVIVQSQDDSLRLINFLMAKSKLMSRFIGKINERQEKVLLRIFAEGLKGFSGGLSAKNYTAIAKTSTATATRDLADLVKRGAMYKTGQLRHTRY